MNVRGKLLLISLFSLLALVGYRVATVTSKQVVTTINERHVRVQTKTLEPQLLTVWVYSEGTVQAQRKAFLNFETGGRVESIATLADGTELREGARVFGPINGTRHGQLLAQIDSRDNLAIVQGLEARLKSTQAQLSEMEARLQQTLNDQHLAANNFLRIREVFEKGAISKEEFDRVNTAKLNANTEVEAAKSAVAAMTSELSSLVSELNRATLSLEKNSLFAPFDGVITAMNIRKDNHYYPFTTSTDDRTREAHSAIVVVDDEKMEVQLEINMLDATKLKEGQTVFLASDDHKLYAAERQGSLERDAVIGVVWSVSPSLNLQRRTQTVKVRVEQNNSRLKDGQFVRAWIAAERVSHALVLPLHALSFKNGQPYVFVFDSATQRVERRDINLGKQGIDVFEVTSGLNADDEVVVRGQHLLVDGASASKLESK